MEKKRNSLASAVIDELGGVVKVAGICKVRAASVSAWRSPAYRMPDSSI